MLCGLRKEGGSHTRGPRHKRTSRTFCERGAPATGQTRHDAPTQRDRRWEAGARRWRGGGRRRFLGTGWQFREVNVVERADFVLCVFYDSKKKIFFFFKSYGIRITSPFKKKRKPSTINRNHRPFSQPRDPGSLGTGPHGHSGHSRTCMSISSMKCAERSYHDTTK